MKKIVEKSYYALVLCFALPSGNLIGIPLKMTLMLICIFAFLWWILYERKSVIVDHVMVLFIGISIFIGIWSIISLKNGYSDTIVMCIKAFYSLLLIVLISYLLYSHKIINLKIVYKLFVIVAIVNVVFKLLSECMLIFEVISWDEYRRLFATLFNSELTTMKTEMGGMIFYRLMTSNDSIPLILFSFFIVFDEKGVLYKISSTVLIFLYVLIIYSRMIFVQFAVMILICSMCLFRNYLYNKTVKNTLTLSLLFFSLFLIVIISIFSNPTIIENTKNAIEERFVGEDTNYSDSFRDRQHEELWRGFEEKPVFGHGLGSYIIGYLRSTSTPFSYEAEYLSFLFQFGIVGVILIILPIFIIIFSMCITYNMDKKICYIVMANLLIWSIKPLFNPQFLSSNSGIIIVTIFLVKNYYNSKLNLNERKVVNAR